MFGPSDNVSAWEEIHLNHQLSVSYNHLWTCIWMPNWHFCGPYTFISFESCHVLKYLSLWNFLFIIGILVWHHCMTCMEAFWLETVPVTVLGKCLGTPVDFFTICSAAMGWVNYKILKSITKLTVLNNLKYMDIVVVYGAEQIFVLMAVHQRRHQCWTNKLLDISMLNEERKLEQIKFGLKICVAKSRVNHGKSISVQVF
jgi:hypothetical protein